MKKKVLLTSMMSIAMLASIASGATYALFTAEDSTNIAVTAGKVAVDAYVDENSLKTYSMGALQTYGTFENGGFAKFDEKSNLKLDLLTPGDKASFVVKVDNNSNVDIKYQITLAMEGELAPALASKVTIAGKEYSLIDGKTGYIDLAAGLDIPDVEVEVELPVEAGNKYQEKSANITVKVEALQGNAPIVDKWDGTADIEWFLENPTAKTFVLDSAEDLAGLAALVDGTATIPATISNQLDQDWATFAGKTFKLETDVDLYAEDENGNRLFFEPIGDASTADFSGVFDGQGHTIYNLRQDCNSKHLALFGAVYEGTVKNLVIDNALVENDGSGYAALVAAYTGASTFENITVRNSTAVNYNHNTGGIVGWCSNNGTTTTFDGIVIESSTTIGSWWGSYDTRVGGIVGAMNTGNYVVIKNSYVACRLDVYNDATSNYQWFNYRTAGMLVGDVRDTEIVDGRTQATPLRVTCENVTVEFGDWANYHYCESKEYGTPSYADEGEWKFRRVEPGLGYSGVDTSMCNHAEDEDHDIVLAFNYLYGARDGKGIYGVTAHEGVTVIYSNN